MKKRALIMVDVQNDFCKNGSLEVPDGDEVVKVMNKLRKDKKWDLIILSQDWHPKDHLSFAINNGKDLFSLIKLNGKDQVMWPVHCVQNSDGAKFHKDLIIEKSDIVIQKGMKKEIDSYSAFFDNNKESKTKLDEILKKNGIEEIYVGGLAWEYCVMFTSLDGSDLGYKVFMVIDATRGIKKSDCDKGNETMKKNGIVLLNSSDVK